MATIEWANRPDSNSPSFFPLLRCKGTKPLTLICLSPDVVGANLHFLGRTLPCSGSTDCEGCTQGRTKRWAGYWAGMLPNRMGFALVEVTASVAPYIDRYRELHGSLRGASISLMRLNQNDNGRIIADIKPGPFPLNELPAAFDVQASLRHMWQMPSKPKADPQALAQAQARAMTPPTNGQPVTNGKHH